MTYNRFVIIGQARTGTTFLQTLLDSHGQIVAYGEVFHLLSRRDLDLEEIVSDPVGYVEGTLYRPYPEAIKAVGYKMLYDQIGGNNAFLRELKTDGVPVETEKRRKGFSGFMRSRFNLEEVSRRFDGFEAYLESDRELKIIHLKRINRLESLLSAKRAARSGAWTSVAGSYVSGSTRLDYKECLDFFRQVGAREAKYDYLFRRHEKIEISYESLAGNTGSAMRLIQDFLAVEHGPLVSPLKKQNEHPVAGVISNFSELKKSFEGSIWARYFETRR